MAVQTLTNPLKHLPAAADGVSVTPSGVAWSSSSWVEITASMSADSLLAAIIARSNTTNTHDVEIDIGTGGAGSETVISSISSRSAAGLAGIGEQMQLMLPILIDAIASGTRVATRLRLSSTNTSVYNISVSYYEKPQAGGSALTTANPSKALPSAANHTSLAASGVAWTNGAWAQITASTAAALVLAAISPNPGASVECEIDIGTGSAGSEVVITTIHLAFFVNRFYYVVLPTPLDNIANGVRLAARQRRNATTGSATVSLTYYEKPL
jgi:hypothetical protein